jgi:hypothetical protein
MWSDPDDNVEGFTISPRGAGFMFGADVCKRFLDCNTVEQIFRAHQLCMEGFRTTFDGTMHTVWSAPDYCYRYDNLASICEINEHLEKRFNQYTSCPEHFQTKKADSLFLGGFNGEESNPYFM